MKKEDNLEIISAKPQNVMKVVIIVLTSSWAIYIHTNNIYFHSVGAKGKEKVDYPLICTVLCFRSIPGSSCPLPQLQLRWENNYKEEDLEDLEQSLKI